MITNQLYSGLLCFKNIWARNCSVIGFNISNVTKLIITSDVFIFANKQNTIVVQCLYMLFLTIFNHSCCKWYIINDLSSDRRIKEHQGSELNVFSIIIEYNNWRILQSSKINLFNIGSSAVNFLFQTLS